MLAKIFNTHPSLVYKWIVKASNKLPEYQINESITEIEFDEIWLSSQKNKIWIIKAIDRRTEKTIAWILGNLDTKIFKRLYDKVKHLTKATFYTDNRTYLVKFFRKKDILLERNI